MKRKKPSRTPMKESAVPHPGQAPVGPDNSIMMQALQLAQAGELGEVEGLNFLGAAAQAQAATNTPKPRKRGPRPSRKKQAALHEKAMFEALGLADAAGEDLEDTRDVNTLNREFLEQGAAEQLQAAEIEALNEEGLTQTNQGYQEQTTLPGGVQIPKQDQMLEELAHGIAYKDITRMKPEEREALRKQLEDMGYELPEVHQDPKTGFQSMALSPLKGRDLPPVLAFRGTADLEGGMSDAGVNGVGSNQFAANREVIHEQLLGLIEKTGRKPITTGHSLGGALAERSIMEYPSLIDRGVTFQGAGTNPKLVQDHLKKVEAGDRPSPEITHYLALRDVVHQSGGHLPGRNIGVETGAGGVMGAGAAVADDVFLDGGGSEIVHAHTQRLLDGGYRAQELSEHPANTGGGATAQEVRRGAGEFLAWGDNYIPDVGHGELPWSSEGMDRYLGSKGSSIDEEPAEDVLARAAALEAEERKKTLRERVHNVGSVDQEEEALRLLKGRPNGEVDFQRVRD